MQRWEEDEAPYFILTGKAPFVVPLEAEIQFAPGAKVRGEPRISNLITGHPSLEETLLEETSSPSAATITLKVEPWVSAESVKKFYRSVQKELVGNSKSSWERNLRVYTFVKRLRAEGVDDSRLPDHWNATAHEEWRYRSAHGFWQAYEAARRQVEEAEYNPLKWRPRHGWRQT